MHQQQQSKERQLPPSAGSTAMMEQKPKRATRYTSLQFSFILTGKQNEKANEEENVSRIRENES